MKLSLEEILLNMAQKAAEGGGSSSGGGSFTGTCSTAAATAEKAVTCPEFLSTDFVVGATITVKFTITNSAAVANLTLNVNGTGAKPIKYIYNGSYSNLPAVGWIVANVMHLFYYDGTNWVMSSLSRNTDDTYNQLSNYNKVVPTTALYRYQLCLTKNETSVIPINAVSNNVGTAKTLTTDTFDPFGPITYYNNTNTVNAAAVIPDGRCYFGILADVRYSFNIVRDGSANTLVANRAVYIVATPQTGGGAKLHSTPLSQTLPTSDNGLIYIYLGIVYPDTNPYRVWMSEQHPVYWFKNSTLQLFTAGKYVIGGSKTSIPNISKKTVVTSASGATATVSNGVLTLTNGSFGTGDSVTVGTAISAYTSLTTL